MGSIINCTRENFCSKVHEFLVKDKNLSYIEAVISSCDVFGIDPSTCKKLLDKNIIDNLQKEGRSINLVQKNSSELKYEK